MQRDGLGGAMVELVAEVLAASFKLRAAGQRSGAVTAWGGGTWGLMRSLTNEGPQTVPQLARARPVARQRIQRLVDELAEAGLVGFVRNPAHKRSKLVRLTREGQRTYAAIDARVRQAAAELARDMDPDSLGTAVAVLRALNLRLAAHLGGKPES